MSTRACRRPVLAGICMWLDLRDALIDRLAFLVLEGLFAFASGVEARQGTFGNSFLRKSLKAPFEGPG
jgi:hypothetical protein